MITYIKWALFDFSRNKGRTFLTSLGILIGVLSVVLLTAFGLGLKKYIENQFESLGANLIFAMPGSEETLMRGGGMVAGIRFDDRDVNKIRKVGEVANIAPVFAKPGSVAKVGDNKEVVEVVASNEEVVPVFNLELEEGRGIEKKDEQKRAKVVLIASTMSEKLFGTPGGTVGRTIVLENQNFMVIGILKSKGGGGLGGGSLDDHVYIPFKSSFPFNTERKYFGIYMKARDKDSVPAAKQQVTNILADRYDEDDFSVMEQTQIMDTVSSIFAIINTVLVAIAAISLVVGGIGIMNIMYVTVTERIKEIGIRRAIGARKINILLQFLVESVMLSVLGGILGLVLAFIIVFFLQPIFPAYIDVNAVMLALGVSSGIGIIFGVFPAKAAADLSPIDAIRYE